MYVRFEHLRPSSIDELLSLLAEKNRIPLFMAAALIF